MLLANPELAYLLSDAIGDSWISNLDELEKLRPLAEESSFCHRWSKVKLQRKDLLATKIMELKNITVDSMSMFDVQTKRIHEYKRQVLNILHVLTLYKRLKRGELQSVSPRTFIFGGKAAPGYAMAKLVIKLINCAADLIISDPEISRFIRVAFLPDFNGKNAQLIYPAADLSEQISTAGFEASGTGNMKFSMNGALTIGTLDGATPVCFARAIAGSFFPCSTHSLNTTTSWFWPTILSTCNARARSAGSGKTTRNGCVNRSLMCP